MTDHFWRKLNDREIDLDEVKEAIETPDNVTDDRNDEDGKKYWKRFGNYRLVVCLNHSRRTPVAKTIFKYLD